MALIDQEGTFRGVITDHAVTLSTGGFPQLVLSLEGIELYDGEMETWCDWTGVAENQLNAYLILIDSKNNETLNYKQVMETLEWDGKSFAGLEALDLSQVVIQFRVEMRTYEEKTRPQVTWIDKYDATPGKTLRKLDTAELKKLDAKFKNVLKGKATPAKAPASAPKGKPAVPKGTVKPPVVKGSRKTATQAQADTKAQAEVKGKMTKDEAWTTCVDLKDDKKVTDQGLADAWVAALGEVAPNKTDEQVTPEEWFQVYEKVADLTAKF